MQTFKTTFFNNEMEEFYKKYFTDEEVKDEIEKEAEFIITKDNDKIVAITSLLSPEQSQYKGYEIGYTCTDENYRKQGLCTKMIAEIINSLPKDVSIFASCWRIRDNEINMKSVMNRLGFKEVQKARVWYDYRYNKDCASCPYKQKDCKCYEDLYVLNR